MTIPPKRELLLIPPTLILPQLALQLLYLTNITLPLLLIKHYLLLHLYQFLLYFSLYNLEMLYLLFVLTLKLVMPLLNRLFLLTYNINLLLRWLMHETISLSLSCLEWVVDFMILLVVVANSITTNAIVIFLTIKSTWLTSIL